MVVEREALKDREGACILTLATRSSVTCIAFVTLVYHPFLVLDHQSTYVQLVIDGNVRLERPLERQVGSGRLGLSVGVVDHLARLRVLRGRRAVGLRGHGLLLVNKLGTGLGSH